MRRRHLLPASVMLALLGLLAWLLVSNLLHPKPRLGVPTKGNFDRVKEGMTAKEVEAILGPPGWHTQRRVPVPVPVCRGSKGWQIEEWVEDHAIILLSISDDFPYERPREGRVVSKSYQELPPESFRERLRRWLPWCERALGLAEDRGPP